MVGIRGRLEVSAMASDAGHRRAGILVGCSIRMAALASQRRMTTQERETGALMSLDHIRDPPGLGRVAASAVITELALVHIRMAGQTFRALVGPGGKFQSLMAGDTPESLVAAGQGEARVLVVEVCILTHFP